MPHSLVFGEQCLTKFSTSLEVHVVTALDLDLVVLSKVQVMYYSTVDQVSAHLSKY